MLHFFFWGGGMFARRKFTDGLKYTGDDWPLPRSTPLFNTLIPRWPTVGRVTYTVVRLVTHAPVGY